MTKMKKIFSLILCLALLLSLSACSLFDSTLVKAIKATMELESLHADISAECSLKAAVSGSLGEHEMELDVAAEATADAITSPFAFRMDAKLNDTEYIPDFIPVPTLTVYGESVGSSVHVYFGADDNFKGYALSLSGDGKLDKGALLKLLTAGAKVFSEVGTEEINGFEAIRYDGVFTEAMMKSLLELAGADESVVISGDIPLSIWINKSSSMIVRIDVDLSGISESLSELISEGLSLNIGQYAIILKLSPENLKLSIRFSGFNSIESINVPEVIAQAKAAA